MGFLQFHFRTDTLGFLVDEFGNILRDCFWDDLCNVSSASCPLIRHQMPSVDCRMTRQQHSSPTMAPLWVLPFLSLIVSSSTGGLLAQALRDHAPSKAFLTTTVSSSMLIMGLSIAVMITTVYLTRLIVHGPPDVGLILSAFVILGPLSQGGFSLLINGQNILELLPLHASPGFPMPMVAGQVLFFVCLCGAYSLWSMALAWITISFLSIYSVARKERIEFSVACWGLIFPNGGFALLSVQFGNVSGSHFFRYFGAIWSCECLYISTDIRFCSAIYIYFQVSFLCYGWSHSSIQYAPSLTPPSSKRRNSSHP
jgi:tellurite resistance protein TehA-like permease